MTMSFEQVTIQRQRRLERKERRHESRKRTILDAARAILTRQGIQNFSVNAVAAAADVSKPAVYYYFESKEELVYELAVEAELEESRKLKLALAEDRGGVNALRALVEGYVTHYLSDLDQYRIRYVWPQVLGISCRLVSAKGRQGTLEVDDLVHQRLLNDQREGRLSAKVGTRQLTMLARVIAHGIVARVSNTATEAGEHEEEASSICDSACAELTRWGLVDC